MGTIHGAEFEGTAAILNLFSILETGKDLLGIEHKELIEMMDKSHIIFIPCLNPDGRMRVPLEGFAGESRDKLRFYDQGTWKDGSLCGWPGCKLVHPMRDYEFLGGYFNDDGINLMHDDFFNPMAEETKLVFSLATKYAPDFIAGLHGAAETGYGIYTPGCAAEDDLKDALEFENKLSFAFKKNGWPYISTYCNNKEREFNQITALYMCCGALSVTWESYQGVLKYEGEVIPENIYEHILDAHFVFFNESFHYAIDKYNKGEFL